MSRKIGESNSIEKVLNGMQKVTEVVASTYGPNGQNVIIEDDNGDPHITKDGVTVVKSLSFSDPEEELGARLLRDAAIKTLKEVGDGTTTTTILATAIAQSGLKYTDKINPFRLRESLEKGFTLLKEQLIKNSISVTPDSTEVYSVALNSANGDQDLARKVTEIYKAIGKEGIVYVKDSDIIGIHTQVIKGISVDRGYSSPLFCKSGQSSVTLENCLVLISRKVIRDYKELIPYMQQARTEQKPILLIVPEIDNTVTELFLTNVYSGVIDGCIIQAPYSHERQDDFLIDLGIAAGAITKDQDYTLNYLVGNAEKVIVGRISTEFQGLHHNDEIYTRHLKYLEDTINSQKDKFLADKARERLAMFSGSIGYIYVGASSETEKLELKDKLDDVIHAVKAALQEGIVDGGGLALFKAKSSLDNIKDPSTADMAAITILSTICDLPLDTLGRWTVNVPNDPTKVVYTALKNAISVAGLLFTSRFVITNEKQEDSL